MIKRIYHGSKSIIKKPIYGYGKKYNDYGLGFYCTENIEMAKEWAVNIDNNGYANIYDLNMNNLKILNLNDSKYTILHWLSILLQNREFEVSSPLAYEAKKYLIENFNVDYSSYDVIIGYRADDSYFSFAQDFINGTISYRQLSNAMHLGRLGEQIVLISQKAFSQLKFVDVEVAEKTEWYSKKEKRNADARNEYFNVERNKRKKDDLYITKILDEEIKENDLRLR